MSARLGTGGVDLSLKNLKSAISGLNAVNKNMQINKVAKQSKMNNAATALRVQYGFGDETQLSNLDSILKGQSALKAGKGEGDAQTITENGKRTIYLNNYKENMTREEKLAMGITIGHEAYRDGITGDTQSQYIETVNAVLGHTVMAKKMQNDDMYNNIMAGIINTNQNLQNDLAVFDYAAMTGDWGAFGSYVNAAYDSSADYWKLMDDGSLAYDGKANLYDENGNLIYKTDSPGIQGSLQEILGLENRTEAYNLMIQAGMKWDGKSWKNSLNPTDDSLAIKMDMTTGENGTGRTYKEIYETRVLRDSTTGFEGTIEQHNPKNIYENMVANGTMDLRPGMAESTIAAYYAGENKYISYKEFKNNNYITGGIPEEGTDYQVGLPIEIKDGNNALITSTFLASGNLGIHYGTDMSILFSKNIYPLLFNDSTTVDLYDRIQDLYTAGGYHVDLNTSVDYIYKNQNYTDSIKQRYMHLDSIKIDSNTTISSSILLGIGGNTGLNTTAAHLHIDISTTQQSPWLSYLSKKNNMSYTSGYKNRVFYNPELFFNNNYTWRYDDANKYNK